MGVVITEARKLSIIIGIAVAVTFLGMIITPIVPTVVTPERYATSNCLAIDPVPDWCVESTPDCLAIGCGPPSCEEECPYFKMEFNSLVEIWSTDHTLEIEKSIQFHSGDVMTGYVDGDDMPGSIDGDLMPGDNMTG